MRNRKIPPISDADKDSVRRLVIHEDAALIVFNKPSGLAVQTRGNRGRNLDYLLWAFARSNGKRPRLIHRIDAHTSGLVVAAKTKPAASFLSEAFAARRVDKRYLALVSGVLPETSHGIITAPLRKPDRDGPPKAEIVPATHAQAQAAETHWRLCSHASNTALMEARPVTGRMHQIRAHLAHIGLPLLGDTLYGGERDTAPHAMLHAASLCLPHPQGATLRLTAPVPPPFAELARKLGLTLPDA